MPEKKELYYLDDDKDETLFQANYADSLYGLRMLLRKDGRKRGLWIWLEEEVNSRLDSDRLRFDRAMKAFLPELEKIFSKNDSSMRKFEVREALCRNFDLFFSRRTEGTAVRLTWSQVRKLAAQLKKGDVSEKEKTEDGE